MKLLKKNLALTISISSILFLFIFFLIYTLYVYVYYDSHNQGIYLEYFNSGKFEFVYENIAYNNDNKPSKEEFNQTIGLMYNKNNLIKIYETYYKDKNIYTDEKEFINEFFYGYKDLDINNIEFNETGETSYFKRKKIYYDNIYLENTNGFKSKIGIINNINLVIEPKSSLELDNKEIKCNNSICILDNIFSGLHTIKYKSNGFTYFALINLYEDNKEISVTNLDNLVAIEEESSKTPNIKPGIYSLSECYIDKCPSKKYSYITLNNNNTCTLYTYISLDKAGDTYNGSYKINGNFITLEFDNHTYSVFDYDTKQTTDITANTEIKYTFKIIDNNSFKNSDYYFEIKE